MGNKKMIAGAALAGAVATLGMIGLEGVTAWVPLITAALASVGLFLWINCG